MTLLKKNENCKHQQKNKVKTSHQYLEKYPIAIKSEKLIVGTIHPHNHENFTIPFFYGNVMSLWNILSEAFPEELRQPLSLPKIINFLNNRKIAVSDTIVACERANPTALDSDITAIMLNRKIIQDIKNSNISEILFTSGFGKNNAFRLFYKDILELPITKEIKINREVLLDSAIFGRPVKLTILYSPSGSSNVGLSKCRLYQENIKKYKKILSDSKE